MRHQHQWAVTKLGGNKSFHCHAHFMNVHEVLVKACNFLFTRLQIFAT